MQGTLFSANDLIECRYRVPIVGWAASETKPAVIAGTFENINSTDLVKVHVRSNAATTLPAGSTVIDLDVEDIDNYNAFDTATNTFTSPRDTCYSMSGHVAVSSGSNATMFAFISATNNPRGNRGETANTFGSTVSINTFCLSQGQTASLSMNTNVPRVSESNNSFFSITELPDYEAIVKNLYDNTTKCQTKYLSANATSAGTISDLTFSGLQSGKKYRANMSLRWINTAGGTTTLSGQADGSAYFQSANSGTLIQIQTEYPRSKVFTSAGGDFTVTVGTDTTFSIYGGGGNTTTWVELCELPDSYVETTEW
jgi:hypothetical protein